MTRAQTNPDIDAVHVRSLGAGPPRALLAMMSDLYDDAVDFVRRRSSTPLQPSDAAPVFDSDPPPSPMPNMTLPLPRKCIPSGP